jgi:hypothetical protein
MTAAATPAAATVFASTGSATSKAPQFGGLLLQLGRMASSSTPIQAAAAKTNTHVNAGQQGTLLEPRATGLTDQATSAPSAIGPAAAGQTGSATNAGQPSAQAESPATELALSAGLKTALATLSTPGSSPPVRERSAVAARGNPVHQSPGAASADGSATAPGTMPALATVPLTQSPASAPEPSQPAPAGDQAERPRLEGAAAKSGPAASAPPVSGNPSEQPDTTADAATMATGPASPSTPAAAAMEAGASPVQSIAAATQQEQLAAAVQFPAQVDAASAVQLPAPVDAAAAPQPDAATAGPAQQVSAAVVSLAGAPGGGQRMTLRLEPAELGQVQIRIDRPQDAPAQVEITVQRPETLTLLLRDQPQLQRALDQAGVPADGRGVTLHIAAPESPAAGNSHSSAAAGADPGQSGGNGAGSRSGGQGRSGDAPDADQDDTLTPLPVWLRAGLDITA